MSSDPLSLHLHLVLNCILVFSAVPTWSIYANCMGGAGGLVNKQEKLLAYPDTDRMLIPGVNRAMLAC